MKKYTVTLIRQVTQTCTLENVMADNGIDAVDTAIASRADSRLWDWQEQEVGETFYREVKEVKREQGK